MRTACTVSFGKNAFAIREDAVFGLTAGALQPFADFDDITNDISVTKPYATYEPNYWLLDGNYKFKPALNPHVGIMGSTLSTSPNGDFATLIDIVIDFSADYSTSGLSFVFSYSGDWMDVITIKFYNSAFTEIQSNVYNPTSTTFSTNQAVSNFRRIHIHLNSTNKAFRYPRIQRLDFDTLTRFTGQEIKTARLVEQINLLSVELPINTLDFSLFSQAGGFSIVNPSGFYATLQYKEPLDVHEDLGGETVYMGRFYLDKWDSVSENEATFEASDAMGLVEANTFIGAYWLDETAENAINTIITNSVPSGISTGISYEIDASLASDRVDGFLDKMSCREALQHICFSIGAYVTCARNRAIQIRPAELTSSIFSYDHILDNTKKGIASPLTLLSLVTGVELTSHDYNEDPNVTGEILVNETLAVGSYTIIFELFAFDYSNTGTTAVLSQEIFNQNHAVITVSTAGLLKWTRVGAIRDTKKIYSIYNGSLPANTRPNIIGITDGLLVSNLVAQATTQRVYDYYQQRYLQKTKLFASRLAPGDSVLVDVQSGKQLKGIVERMETDLAGGFVSNVEIVGVVI